AEVPGTTMSAFVSVAPRSRNVSETLIAPRSVSVPPVRSRSEFAVTVRAPLLPDACVTVATVEIVTSSHELGMRPRFQLLPSVHEKPSPPPVQEIGLPSVWQESAIGCPTTNFNSFKASVAVIDALLSTSQMQIRHELEPTAVRRIPSASDAESVASPL